MRDKVLIDSYTLLAYLKKEDNYNKVVNLFKSENSQILINDMEIGRVFYILAQERGLEKAQYFLQKIVPTLPINHVENTYDDVLEAARIKSAHSLSYLSCFTVVTALKEDALLISGNPEFKGVKDVIKYESLD